ncbi:peptidase family C78-domain-containing protein [Aspergillus multicolor]|uniref:peptidase family C78-domain-containing protein n=1 Tax=Aspergillus multicolor TaxID=41759 RepID=UPI003CCC96B9
MSAHSFLLSHVAAYFRMGLNGQTEKVVLTDLPPIYFQHHGLAALATGGVRLTIIGHSMTIVGFEIREQGSGNLLVLDPGLKTPSVIKHAMTTKIKTMDPGHILKGFRKGPNYLQKYQTFELLRYAMKPTALLPARLTLQAITSQPPADDLNHSQQTLCMKLIDCSDIYCRVCRHNLNVRPARRSVVPKDSTPTKFFSWHLKYRASGINSRTLSFSDFGPSISY